MCNPTVVAVMLANGRPEMVKRAVSSFRHQTYQEKRLFVLDTTPEALHIQNEDGVYSEHLASSLSGERIGTLRNAANEYAHPKCLNGEIIAHFDSDDLSHPNRIAEQVALLQSSGADVVGFREMLFWRDKAHVRQSYDDAISLYRTARDYPEGFNPDAGQAWLYSHPMPTYALGTSLMYWRRTWEAHPFIDGNQEDWHFIHAPGVRVVGVRSIGYPVASPQLEEAPGEPRMVASIHGGNTCSKIEPACDEWRRVPEWDSYCRRTMEGK